MIFKVMNLKSLSTLAAVNRRLRASICSLRVIRDSQKSHTASNALSHLIKDNAGTAFTIVDFDCALKSKACAACCAQNEFAPFLDIATCHRICFSCGQFEHVFTKPKHVLLPYLDSSSDSVQFHAGRICEGCARDLDRNPSPDVTSQARAEKAYLEDQFLEHFSKCETAWKIAAGQRMRVMDEERLCLELRWGLRLLPIASTIHAATDDLEYGEELTPEAFRAEYERLRGIKLESKAQMEEATRKIPRSSGS